MAKRILTPVPAKVVREYARAGKVTLLDSAIASIDGGPQGRGRGRISAATAEAFNVENGDGLVYAGETSVLEQRQVTLALTKPNARGARLNRPEAFPIADVRKRAGVVGKAGRLSNADKEKAAKSVMKERGWL